MRLSDPQWRALNSVRNWGCPRYMPFADQQRTFKALEKRGLVAWRRVEDGHQTNGYVLTNAGLSALEQQPADLGARGVSDAD